MLRFILSLAFAVSGTSMASAASILDPILPPSDGWSSELSECVLTEFKTASGLQFESIFIASGPAYARDGSGADVKTKAEYLVASELVSGQRRGFKVHFLSDDGADWRFYQDPGTGIGVYGMSMDPVVQVYDSRGGAMLFGVSVESCREYIGR